MTTEEKTLSMKMPASLHTRLKLEAVKDGKTITDIIIDLVEKWLARKEKSQG